MHTSAQSVSYNFFKDQKYQIQAISSDGQIFGARLSSDGKKVEQTIFIDNDINNSRITFFNDDNKPMESYQGEKVYAYSNEGNQLYMMSSEESENTQMMDDAHLLKNYGLDLSFTDEIAANNSNWLDSLSKYKNYLDATLTGIAFVETGVSCLAVGVNPVMAIPCTKGILNIIAANYDKNNPLVTTSLMVNAKKLEALEAYLKGKKVSVWPDVMDYINLADDYYTTRREKLHAKAEKIRSLINERDLLKVTQSYSQKGINDSIFMKSCCGIIASAIDSTDRLEKKLDEIRKNANADNYAASMVQKPMILTTPNRFKLTTQS
jgi:hypothetical protein